MDGAATGKGSTGGGVASTTGRRAGISSATGVCEGAAALPEALLARCVFPLLDPCGFSHCVVCARGVQAGSSLKRFPAGGRNEITKLPTSL